MRKTLFDIGVASSLGVMTLLWVAPAPAQSTPEKQEQPTPAATSDNKDAAKETAKDTAKDAKETAKETQDTAKESAKDVKDARDTAKDSAKDAKDTAKDTARDARDTARDTARDARDTRDTARDARDSRDSRGSRDERDARDSRDDRDSLGAREDARSTRDTRDTRESRDSRDDRGSRTTRDDRDSRTTRDDRDSRNTREDRDSRETGDVRRESSRSESRVSRSSREEFDVSTFRSADMGLWFRSTDDGLVIRDVASSGPITRLGFREGDRILSVNGERVTRERDFIHYIFAEDVREERVKVIVLRDDREEVIWIEPVVFIEEVHVAHHDPLEEFGIIVDDRYDDQVVVLKVIPRSPAYYAGIRAGDVITVFDGHEIHSPKEFVTYVRDVRSVNVAVKVDRDRRVRELDVEFNNVERSTSVRDERREDRIERRDDRRDRRVNRDDRGVRVDVDQRPGATPRVDVDTPRGGVEVNPQRGGILPRIRGR